MTAKGRWWALAAVSLATLMTYLVVMHGSQRKQVGLHVRGYVRAPEGLGTWITQDLGGSLCRGG